MDCDISNPDTMATFLNTKDKNDPWFHFCMLGALLKYKKLQQLLMVRRISVVR